MTSLSAGNSPSRCFLQYSSCSLSDASCKYCRCHFALWKCYVQTGRPWKSFKQRSTQNCCQGMPLREIFLQFICEFQFLWLGQDEILFQARLMTDILSYISRVFISCLLLVMVMIIYNDYFCNCSYWAAQPIS